MIALKWIKNGYVIDKTTKPYFCIKQQSGLLINKIMSRGGKDYEQTNENININGPCRDLIDGRVPK